MAREATPATIVDVALAAGVSKSAAARVLSNKGSASAKTRERVLDAAAQLGYRPNQLAKAMKSGSTRTLGVVLPDVANPFFSAVLRGFSDAARGAGFEIVVINTDNRIQIESRSLELLAEKRVDGIAIAPVLQDASDAIAQLRDEGMPIVLIDRRLPNLRDLPLISMDHPAATSLATDALIADGHTRIAIVTEAAAELDEVRHLISLDPHETSLLRPSMQRLLGYVRSLESAGIRYDPRLVVTTPYERTAAEEAVAAFLRSDNDATAMHATNAVLTYASYRAFVTQEIVVPDDISFIGFDDQDWMLLIRPNVTVIGQASQDLGETAARALLSVVDGRETPADTFLSARLIARETVRRFTGTTSS